ncbi:ATP-binding cassette domain-containing protein [Spiroplasma sp. BIUS-1]|uniref:ABC transporter ATP-binding protein n=1 Tax=Spiroplasma sp. BIUS-1 TaxID=216964 RepID=UPI0013982AC8|nr:ABC transporter ATP-binding protein [Spiroplasma sp. BIUS-1]QHX36551.1 ABC transporter ATP-binding protein [Spiroplasma sp. BIUS-1]
MIEILNLTKEFKNGGGIYDVSFNFDKNDIIALVGPNGAGKTTLIKCIMKEYKISSGNVLLNSKKIGNKELKSIVFFPDTNNIILDIKLKEYIKYCYACSGLPLKDFENTLNEVSRWLKIEPFLNKKISELSAGQKKKAILGSVLVRKPQYIIFDEPTANMDIENKKEFINIIKSLEKANVSIMITSHIVEELQMLANKLVIIKQGKVIYKNKFDKEKEQIIDIYSSLSVDSDLNQEVMRLYS